MDYKKAIADFLNKHMDQIEHGSPGMSPTLGGDTYGLQGIVNNMKTDRNQIHDADQVEPLPPPPNQEPVAMPGFADGTESVPPPTFDPNSGMPPAPPVNAAPVAPNNSIQSYIGQQKQQLGQYGPEQQMAVSKSLLDQQNGTRGTLANAGTGLADALMQGVARAGNPGFQANLQNRQNAQAGMQMDALKGAREANTQNVGANQRLDAMDPQSPLSASKRAQNGPILQAMGFDPKTIGQMSAAEMDTTMNLLKDFRGKDMEVAVAKMKAAIEARRDQETARHNVSSEGLEATKTGEAMRHNVADEANKNEEIKSGMLEKAAAVPVMSRIASVLGGNPAQKALQDQALSGSYTPDVINYAKSHGITPEQANTIKQQRGGR